MKIEVTITIEVTATDIDDWCTEYGTERHEVYEDVKSYAINGVQQLYGFHDLEGTVTGK